MKSWKRQVLALLMVGMVSLPILPITALAGETIQEDDMENPNAASGLASDPYNMEDQSVTEEAEGIEDRIEETESIEDIADITETDGDLMPAENLESQVLYEEEAAKKIREEFSQNGNHVTQYENEEDKKIKTIIWASGITPPEMNDFIKEKTPSTGNPKYVVYKAPYQQGNGWYDVNKTIDRVEDNSLCFAAAASNALHWWLEQNNSYIDRYLEKYPDAPKNAELQTLRNSFQDQKNSAIYKRFVKKFSQMKDGYWSDILIDQFINGYEPKSGGGVNDPEFDGETLLEKGPSEFGGFFYPLFGPDIVTKRMDDGGNFKAFSDDLKRFFKQGDLVLLDYSVMGSVQHVVTLWGAEYDLDGTISAVYLSDSDDEKEPYGMVRYMIKNKGGSPVLTTDLEGTDGSRIGYFQVISKGSDLWEKGLNGKPETQKTVLNLKWENKEFIYDGTPKKPTVSADNISDGDDVTVEVEGEQVDAGKYIAQAVLSGTASEKYELPDNSTIEFTIAKAEADVSLVAEQHFEENNIEFHINVNGIGNENLDGTIVLKDGEKIITDTLALLNGNASYTWIDFGEGNHNITAEFIPLESGSGKNYNVSRSDEVMIDVSKKEQTDFKMLPVPDKVYGGESFVLKSTGGSGTGEITYSCNSDDVLRIQGDMAEIVGAGTAEITAVKAGDSKYNSAVDVQTITVNRAIPLLIISSEIREDGGEYQVIFKVKAEKSGNGDNVTGEVALIDCTEKDPKKIADKISVSDGEAEYVWKGMKKQNYKIKAFYSGNANYDSSYSSEIEVQLNESLEPQPEPQPQPQPEPEPQPEPGSQPQPQPGSQPEPQPQPQSEPQLAPQPQPQLEPQAAPQPELQPEKSKKEDQLQSGTTVSDGKQSVTVKETQEQKNERKQTTEESARYRKNNMDAEEPEQVQEVESEKNEVTFHKSGRGKGWMILSGILFIGGLAGVVIYIKRR